MHVYHLCGGLFQSNDNFVSGVLQDDQLLEKIYALIKSDSNINLYEIQKGETGSTRSFENKIEVNSIDDLKKAWGTRCHLSTFVAYEEIDESCFEKLFISLREILPIYMEICEINMNPNFIDYLYTLFTYKGDFFDELINYIEKNLVSVTISKPKSKSVPKKITDEDSCK